MRFWCLALLLVVAIVLVLFRFVALRGIGMCFVVSLFFIVFSPEKGAPIDSPRRCASTDLFFLPKRINPPTHFVGVCKGAERYPLRA